MKKPDCYIAFDWPKFQADTFAMSRQHKWSYWNACCAYYWQECRGLEDSDEVLRRACECYDLADWAVTKGLIFGSLFKKEEDGKWHQKRTREEYHLALDQINNASNRGRAGANARWGKQEECSSNAQAMPEDMHKQWPSPTPTPTSVPTPPPTPIERESNGPADANIPTLAEVKKLGACRGILPEVCESFFNYHEGNQLWLNKHGRLINWQHKLTTWQVKDRQPKPGKVSNVNVPEQGLSGADKVILQNEMERILTRIKSLKDDYSSHQDMSDADRSKLKDLRIRLNEIKTKLGIKY